MSGPSDNWAPLTRDHELDTVGGEVEVVSDAVTQARANLGEKVDKTDLEYKWLLNTIKEDLIGPIKIENGEILDGLYILDYYFKDNKFEKGEDTYQCCAALHRWTKYLACDDRYKKEKASKDDRFKGIYRNNYKFRRRWVAFLSGIVAYVELMYENEGERKVDAIHLELKKLTGGRVLLLDGFHWTTVKGHIDAAKALLEKEPTSAPWTNYLPFDVHRRAVLEGEDGRRRDVTELLDRLRELIYM
jgi:hypothetical protein